MGRAKSFTEMGQLNLYLPKWQIDELERIGKLSNMSKSKYAHKLIADGLKPKAPKEEAKPVFAKPEGIPNQPDTTPPEALDTSDIDNILKF